MESASKNLTRVTLELCATLLHFPLSPSANRLLYRGGNDPAIVCPDVDILSVASQIANLSFLNSGQICIAIKRVYVHKDIYVPFREAFVKHVESLKVGGGFENGVFLGPVQNKLQYNKVESFLEDIHENNQTIATGGQIIDTEQNGLFIRPTVIDNPQDDSKIVMEEPFGPIVPLMEWSDDNEVIQRANSSDMGLGASVWSSDIDRAVRIGECLEAGSVWINEHIAIKPTATFGGHKQSGIGCEWGTDGLRGYCNTQTVFLNQRQTASSL